MVIHVSQAFVIASDLIRLPEQRISATGRTVTRIMAPMARLKAKSADAAPASGPADRGAHDLFSWAVCQYLEYLTAVVAAQTNTRRA